MTALTPGQRNALLWVNKARGPITIADLPLDMTLSTLRILSERGLLAITVDMTPSGTRAVLTVLENMERTKFAHLRKSLAEQRAAARDRRAAFQPATSAMEPSQLQTPSKADLMGSRARVRRTDAK